MAAEPSLSGCVYFVLCPGANMVKIGWSERDPCGRFDVHQAGSPLPLIKWRVMDAVFADEGALHERFREEWSHNEWFHLSERLREYIESDARSWMEWLSERAAAAEARYEIESERAQREWYAEYAEVQSRRDIDLEDQCWMHGINPHVMHPDEARAKLRAKFEANEARRAERLAQGIEFGVSFPTKQAKDGPQLPRTPRRPKVPKPPVDPYADRLSTIVPLLKQIDAERAAKKAAKKQALLDAAREEPS